MTTGICAVSGAFLRRRQTSKPSMPGIITSSRTMSHRPCSQSAERVGPVHGGDDVEILGRELGLEQLDVGEDVVDDEDAGGH